MLDLGWSELLLIGIAALIVVGPRDLPRMLRTLGRYAAKAKSVAREFQRSMDEAARQADMDELRDMRKELDRDMTGMREEQYRLQREMSQSYMGKSNETGAKPAGGDGAAPAGAEAPKADGAKPEAPKSDAPKADAPKADAPRTGATGADAPPAAPAGGSEPRKVGGA